MSISIDKSFFTEPTVNAFNDNESVNVNSIYTNYNDDSKKDIITKASEVIQKTATGTQLKNYVSFILNASLPSIKQIAPLTQYRNKANDFIYKYLKDKQEDYFVELNAGINDVVDLSPLGKPNISKLLFSSFSIDTMFLLYKTTGKFRQKIFIQNDFLVAPNKNFTYYDNQFLFNSSDYYVYYAVVIQLKFNKGGSAEAVISSKFDYLVNKPPFVPKIPSTSIFSYTNINNKLLFMFSKNIGSDVSTANSIELFTAEQIQLFKQIIKTKGIEYKENLIYSVGSSEKNFVIYRTNQKPETYADIIKETNIIKKLDINKLETSYVDNVSPNTKYYYCFRTENIFGFLSDASLVYEMQVVDQSGTIYMVQNVFKPEKKVEFIKSLQFENRVRIFPTQLQINIPDKLLKIVGE